MWWEGEFEPQLLRTAGNLLPPHSPSSLSHCPLNLPSSSVSALPRLPDPEIPDAPSRILAAPALTSVPPAPHHSHLFPTPHRCIPCLWKRQPRPRLLGESNEAAEAKVRGVPPCKHLESSTPFPREPVTPSGAQAQKRGMVK